jgi:uncharacterized metal-binding protein
MPDGKTHDMLTVVSGVVGIPVLTVLLPDHNLAAALTWAGAHLVSGLAFSPDLDLASEPYRRWGPLRYIWFPYREFVPHRAWVSHSLFFGPLMRLAYFLLMAWLSFYIGLLLFNYLTPVDAWAISRQFGLALQDLWASHRSMAVYFLTGFVTGGAVHTLADWFMVGGEPFHRSLFKSRRRRRGRRDDDEWGIW